MNYRPEIDGLRAIVAFPAFPETLPGGFVGADGFLVISGFLISGIIISALHAGMFSYADFYARRSSYFSLANAAVAVGALLLGAALWFLSPDSAFPGLWALLPAVGTCLTSPRQPGPRATWA